MSRADPKGIGAARTVTVDPDTRELSLPLEVVVEIDAVTGFAVLPAGCRVGPISGTLTGTTMLVTHDLELAATAACGAYYDLFNGVLALPGTADAIFATRTTLP